MTIHRFYVETLEKDENTVLFSGELAHQIAKVLRLESGDVIVVFTKEKKEYTLMLSEVTKAKVTARIIKETTNTSDPKILVHLYQSILPREKFEDVLEKGTEVGISAFTPVQTERTVVKDVTKEKLERWKKITQEAAEQSERGMVPTVFPLLSFTNAVQEATKSGAVFIAWEEETDNFPSAVLSHVILGMNEVKTPESRQSDSGIDSGQARMTISLFIGPEGGFTPEEIAFAKEQGVQTISLGPRILRSETAGIVLASLLLFSTGDFDRK